MASVDNICRNLVLVGDGDCGKTFLLKMFLDGRLPEEYLFPEFRNYEANIEVDGKQVKLGLRDTAGQEDYDRLRPPTYHDVDGCIICFSVNSLCSFENVQRKWVPEIRKFCPTAPIVLVGNKTDLRSNPENLSRLAERHRKPITVKEGRAMAKNIGSFAYVECSALSQEGIQEVFDTATRAALAAEGIAAADKAKKKRKNNCMVS